MIEEQLLKNLDVDKKGFPSAPVDRARNTHWDAYKPKDKEKHDTPFAYRETSTSFDPYSFLAEIPLDFFELCDD